MTYDESALPIELMFFNATKYRNKVYLNWKTASETQNQKFIIERNNEVIKQIRGAGTTTEINEYFYMDALLSNENRIYKLYSLSYNNEKELCGTKEIIFEDTLSNIQVNSLYPNPTNAYINIDIQSNVNKNVSIKLIDMSGNLVKEYDRYTITEGLNALRINLKCIQSAVYVLSINNETNKKITILK